MKTDTKYFDCVELMHEGAVQIYEETKEMTLKEEMAYWRQKHVEAVGELNPPLDSTSEK